MPILLTLEQVVNGGITNNLTQGGNGSVPQFGGFPKSNLASKFINFGTNEASIF
jgi:hypothetical protein